MLKTNNNEKEKSSEHRIIWVNRTVTFVPENPQTVTTISLYILH